MEDNIKNSDERFDSNQTDDLNRNDGDNTERLRRKRTFRKRITPEDGYNRERSYPSDNSYEKPYYGDREDNRSFNRERSFNNDRNFNSDKPYDSEKKYDNERPYDKPRPYEKKDDNGFNRSYNRPDNFSRERYDNRDRYNNRDSRDTRDTRDTRDRFNTRDSRDTRDRYNNRDTRDTREPRDNREGGSGYYNRERYGNRDDNYNNRNRYNNRDDYYGNRPYNRDGVDGGRSFNRDNRDTRDNRDSRDNRDTRDNRTRDNRTGGYDNRTGGYDNRTGGYDNRRSYGSNDRNRSSSNNRFSNNRSFNNKKFNQKRKPSKPKMYKTYDGQLPEDGLMRLNKFISNSGLCSRREADQFITSGAVTVNAQVINELGVKVNIYDDVKVNERTIITERKVYILLNKPKGLVTTLDDPNAKKTVMDLLRHCCKERIYPVGRLDKASTGVLLLTNDGELTTRLTQPKFKKKKIYHVHLDKELSIEDMESIAKGVELEDGISFADEIGFPEPDDKTKVGIEIHSGKNRIIRRIFQYMGYKVKKLDRVYFAGLTKKGLGRGKWRFLTDREVNYLKIQAFEMQP